MSRSRDSEQFWASVAAFGALWGTVEITLGSFMHTLRVPMAGEWLASIGAGFLVAQRQVLPRRGLTVATGAVACLCKSVSPGGVILGPMVGIFMEAVLVELALLLWPRSRLAAAFAGFLAATWALSQKTVTHIVVYGADVVRLWLAMLEETAESLSIPASAGWGALAAVVAIVFAVGATFGLLGRRAGLAAMRKLAENVESTEVQQVPQLSIAAEEARPAHRRPMAGLALLCLAAQFGGDLRLSVLALLVWLLALCRMDPKALRRMWMPRFWAITLFFGLGGGLFLGKRETLVLGIPLSMYGLEAGAIMAVRGALFFGLGSWASRALRRSDFERWLGHIGASRLGTAIATAFQLLPALKERMEAVRTLHHRKGVLQRVSAAYDLAVDLITETSRIARRMTED